MFIREKLANFELLKIDFCGIHDRKQENIIENATVLLMEGL